MYTKIEYLVAFTFVITMSLLCCAYAQDTSDNIRTCFQIDAKIPEGDKLIASWNGIDIDYPSYAKRHYRSNACSNSKKVLNVSEGGAMLRLSFKLNDTYNNTYVLIRYSRNYFAPIGVKIYLDDKDMPGGRYTEITTDWNNFKVLPPILFGNLTKGQHNISLSIDKNEWGMEIDVVGVFGIRVPPIEVPPIGNRDIPYKFDENDIEITNSTAEQLEKNHASSPDLQLVPSISFDNNVKRPHMTFVDLAIDSNSKYVKDAAASIIAPYPGNLTIDQLCAIFDYLKNGNDTKKGWGYLPDPGTGENFQYANETLKRGIELGRSGIGDCDDFAILMAGLVEAIGGTPRIVLAKDGDLGHAYTEVYLGNLESQGNQVTEIIQWLREKYLIDKVYVYINSETKDIWLNLDWGADERGANHPGGPFFRGDIHSIIAIRDANKSPLNVIKIHKVKSQRAILPNNAVKVSQLAQLSLVGPKQVAWSTDGKQLAVADYNLHIYDTQTWKEVSMINTGGWITSIAFSPNGKTLASVSMGNNMVTLWDAASGGEVRTFGSIPSASYVAFSPDGKTLAVGAGMTIKLLDAENGKELDTIIVGSKINSLAFSPYGHILASGADDIKIWDLSNGTKLGMSDVEAPLFTLLGHSNNIQSVAFSPYGLVLASGSVDKTVKLWDVAKGQELKTLLGHNSQVDGVAFSPDGRLLASASWDPTIKLWDVSNGLDLKTLKGHTTWVKCVAFSPDGSMLASGSDDGTVKIWGIPP